jgi:hypothetical protein
MKNFIPKAAGCLLFCRPSGHCKGAEGSIFFSRTPILLGKRGFIENTNKLIRQYIPKKANFDDFSYLKIKEIQYNISCS